MGPARGGDESSQVIDQSFLAPRASTSSLAVPPQGNAVARRHNFLDVWLSGRRGRLSQPAQFTCLCERLARVVAQPAAVRPQWGR